MELIEREALYKQFYDAIHSSSSAPYYPLQMIEQAPTIDAAPVVHGHWIKHDGYTECSECEYWYDSPEIEEAGDRSNYCPNCGARMGGGD